MPSANASTDATRARISPPMLRGEEGSFHLRPLENRVRLTPEHVFRIGSLTKPITAAAIFHLVDRGKLSLDDRACRWVAGCGREP